MFATNGGAARMGTVRNCLPVTTIGIIRREVAVATLDFRLSRRLPAGVCPRPKRKRCAWRADPRCPTSLLPARRIDASSSDPSLLRVALADPDLLGRPAGTRAAVHRRCSGSGSGLISPLRYLCVRYWRTMDPYQLRRLGRTNLHLPAVGLGTATIGDMRGAIPEAQALATVEAAWAAGISFYDTAPWYGRGKSELRLGAALRPKPRDAYVLTTKIGRTLHRPADPQAFAAAMVDGSLPIEIRFDYTRDGVMRSYEDSIQRLGIPEIDALLIHDLDPMHHGDDGVEPFLRQLEDGGGFAALAELKASGQIKAIGAGINMLGMIPRFLPRFPIDFFIVAMPYTLLDQGALDVEFPLCEAHGAGVVIGAPFASGILASRTGSAATYAYRPVEDATSKRVAAIEAVCSAHGVPIGAVALQFPLAHPLVASIIPGPNHPDQVRANLSWLRTPVPGSLWSDLKAAGLIRADAPVPA